MKRAARRWCLVTGSLSSATRLYVVLARNRSRPEDAWLVLDDKRTLRGRFVDPTPELEHGPTIVEFDVTFATPLAKRALVLEVRHSGDSPHVAAFVWESDRRALSTPPRAVPLDALDGPILLRLRELRTELRALKARSESFDASSIDAIARYVVDRAAGAAVPVHVRADAVGFISGTYVGGSAMQELRRTCHTAELCAREFFRELDALTDTWAKDPTKRRRMARLSAKLDSRVRARSRSKAGQELAFPPSRSLTKSVRDLEPELSALVVRHFPSTAGAPVDDEAVENAFALFATESLAVRSPDPVTRRLLHGQGVPDGDFFFQFAELALTIVEYATNGRCPDARADLWSSLVQPFVLCSHLYAALSACDEQGTCYHFGYRPGRVLDEQIERRIRRQFRGRGLERRGAAEYHDLLRRIRAAQESAVPGLGGEPPEDEDERASYVGSLSAHVGTIVDAAENLFGTAPEH